MTVLTDKDYEDLRPFLPVIRNYRNTGGWVSTAPHVHMARIMNERYNEHVNIHCSGCLARMYDIMNVLIDQYETKLNSEK